MSIRALFLPALFLHPCAAAQQHVNPAEAVAPPQAQDPAPSARPQEPAPPANKGGPGVAMTPAVLVTLSFRGGTLGEFVAQIRAAVPPANIIVAAGAASAQLPAIELRGAGLDSALEGACAVAQSDALIRVKDFRGAGQTVYTITATEPVMTMSRGPNAVGPGGTANNFSGVSATTMRREMTEVFSLNRLLDPKDGTGFAIATVLSAIEAAVGTEPPLASLRFHKESGLLIVRGNMEQVGTVRDVLGSLERDVLERTRQQNAKKGMPNDPAVQTPK